MTLFLIIVAIVIIGLVVWYSMTGRPKGSIVPKAAAGPIIPPLPPPPPPVPPPPSETPGM